MADNFTQNRMAWLDRVMVDRETPSSGFRVAFVIAYHLNRKTGESFPSHSRIAELASLSPRQVSDLIKGLRIRGHLAVQRRPNQSNCYRLTAGPVLQPAAVPTPRVSAVPELQLTSEPEARPELQSSVVRNCSPPLTNPLKEPKEVKGGSVEARHALALPVRAAATGRAPVGRRSSFVPDDWQPPANAFDLGAKYGLSNDETAREIAKFRNHEFKAPKSDWDRAWCNWIVKAGEMKAGRNGQSSRQSSNKSWARGALGE